MSCKSTKIGIMSLRYGPVYRAKKAFSTSREVDNNTSCYNMMVVKLKDVIDEDVIMLKVLPSQFCNI